MVLIALLTLVGSRPSYAGTYSHVYFFQGGADGQWPIGGLLGDGKGTFYGTTLGGGTATLGTVYSIDASGTHTVLYNFHGLDGQLPTSTLTLTPTGELYGTTYSGGAYGFGTVFRLTPHPSHWEETVVYSFQGIAADDGSYPVAGLLLDRAGNFYGTTGFGGRYNKGTVFRIDAQGLESVLYHFMGGSDGAYPLAPVAMDGHHNLFGTTTEGGAQGVGTVFSLSPSGDEQVVYSFQGYYDGAFPYFSPVYPDSKGNLYGTTMFGGSRTQGGFYKVSSDGSEYTISFCGGFADACAPVGGLVRFQGKFYGTSEFFYSVTVGGFGYGGDLFSLTDDGIYTDLYSFASTYTTVETDGYYPVATLTADPTGTGAIYGTTFEGHPNLVTGEMGWGEIFKYTLP